MPPKRRLSNPHRSSKRSTVVRSLTQRLSELAAELPSDPPGSITFENQPTSSTVSDHISDDTLKVAAPVARRHSSNSQSAVLSSPSTERYQSHVDDPVTPGGDHMDIDLESSSQIPVPPAAAMNVVSTPVQKSPSKSDIRPSLSDARSNRKHDGLRLQAAMAATYEKELQRVTPMKNLVTFVRDHLVQEKWNVYREDGVPGTSGAVRQCADNWYKASRDRSKTSKNASLRPFLHLGDVLKDAVGALSYDMGRIWFEDFLVLCKGDVVTILIHPKHCILCGKNKVERRTIGLDKETLEKIILANPYSVVQIGNRSYFAIRATVRSNPKYSEFVDGNLTRREFRDVLNPRLGAGVTFEADAVVGEGDGVQLKTFTIFYISAVERPLEFLVFKQNYCSSRRISDFKRMMNNYKDYVRMAAAAEVYKDYVFGDRLQTYAMYTHLSFKKIQKENDIEFENYKAAPLSDERFLNHLDIDDQSLTVFRTYIDSVCKETIDGLYGRFSTFAMPILTQSTLTNFVNQFKLTLPTQYKALLCMIGKDDNTERILRNKWLWDRCTFYMFIHLMQMRDTKNFVWWGMINAAADYGRGGSNIPTFFGAATSQRTLMRNLTALCPYDEIMKRTVETLQPLAFVVATFDNSQIIREKKFQRGGSSSSVTLVTSRMFVKAMIPCCINLLQWDNNPVEITYSKQAIPSPFGLPKFEELDVIDEDVFNNEKWVTNSSSMDVSGLRVLKYANVIEVAYQMSRMRKIIPFWLESFSFGNSEHLDSMAKLRIVERLKPLVQTSLKPRKEDGFPGRKAGLLRRIDSFQRSCTYTWRNAGDISPASTIIPPVSPEDETTNVGAGQNVVSLLLMRGILEPSKRGGEDGDVSKVRLADDYKSKWLMLVGDGLTQIRVKTFIELIQQSSFNFGDQHDTTEMIRKALGQVVHVTGDLHGGLFHFLSSIYALFYGSLIQPVQELVAWKRICGTDVTKCYQQAAGLAQIISTELERGLMAMYFHSLETQGSGEDDFISDTDVPENIERLGVKIAVGFNKWIVEKQASTTNETLRMVLNYVRLVSLYRLFREAMACGDAVMIEHLYSVFLPIFLYTGKKNITLILFVG